MDEGQGGGIGKDELMQYGRLAVICRFLQI